LTDALPPASAGPGPKPPRERIVALDCLRGFAVLGILLMNIQSFSMIGAAYENPRAFGDLSGGNYVVWLLCHVLADQKFVSIFSMLFGAGVVLMAARREQAGVPAAALHYRRMAVLLVFGLMHAYLLWFGDILTAYALCGMLIYPMRRLPPWLLIMFGSIVWTGPIVILSFFGVTLPFWPPDELRELLDEWAPSAAAAAEEIAAYRGGWLAQMPQRAKLAVLLQTVVFALGTFWVAGGLMILGMGLHKLGMFAAGWSRRTYAAIIAAGAAVGLPIVLYGVHWNEAAAWDGRYSMFFGSLYNYVGSLPLALGWVAALMWSCRSGRAPLLANALAAVGRMALTNYLLQTVICTSLFYGHGLGLFCRVERVGQVVVVAGVWVLQLIMSPLWLRRFEFGPVEWLWRRLSYAGEQPQLSTSRAPRRPQAL